MLKNIINNKIIFKSLVTILFFTINFKLSSAFVKVENLEKNNKIVSKDDIENYFDFIENFDRYAYVNFIMDLEYDFQVKFHSSYKVVWSRLNLYHKDENDYYFFRMFGNIIRAFTTRHGVISSYKDNADISRSRISPFRTQEFYLDLFHQRSKYFPIYLTEIYTKAKLHFNTTGFSNSFFNKFYGNTGNKIEKMVKFSNSFKKNAIGSFYDWWISTNDNYYMDYKILIFFFFSSFFISFMIFTISNIVGNSTSIFFERSKTSVYECGFQPFERIDKCQIFVFYRLSIFFIIFEAELIFLYPWAINVCEMAIYSISFFYNASFFIFILFYGFIFEIKNKALDV